MKAVRVDTKPDKEVMTSATFLESVVELLLAHYDLSEILFHRLMRRQAQITSGTAKFYCGKFVT